MNWNKDIRPFVKQRRTKGVSPYVPGKDKYSIPLYTDYSNEYSKIGRIFTPEQKERYDSNWRRYSRALELNDPNVSFDDFNRQIYYYESKFSPDGYWAVTYADATTTIKENIIIIPNNSFSLESSDVITVTGINPKWDVIQSSNDISFSNENENYPKLTVSTTQDKSYINILPRAELTISINGVIKGTTDETRLCKSLFVYTAPSQIIDVKLQIENLKKKDTRNPSTAELKDDFIPKEYIVYPKLGLWINASNELIEDDDDLILLIEALESQEVNTTVVSLSNITNSFFQSFNVTLPKLYNITLNEYSFFIRGHNDKKDYINDQIVDNYGLTLYQGLTKANELLSKVEQGLIISGVQHYKDISLTQSKVTFHSEWYDFNTSPVITAENPTIAVDVSKWNSKQLPTLYRLDIDSANSEFTVYTRKYLGFKPITWANRIYPTITPKQALYEGEYFNVSDTIVGTWNSDGVSLLELVTGKVQRFDINNLTTNLFKPKFLQINQAFYKQDSKELLIASNQGLLVVTLSESKDDDTLYLFEIERPISIECLGVDNDFILTPSSVRKYPNYSKQFSINLTDALYIKSDDDDLLIVVREEQGYKLYWYINFTLITGALITEDISSPESISVNSNHDWVLRLGNQYLKLIPSSSSFSLLAYTPINKVLFLNSYLVTSDKLINLYDDSVIATYSPITLEINLQLNRGLLLTSNFLYYFLDQQDINDELHWKEIKTLDIIKDKSIDLIDNLSVTFSNESYEDYSYIIFVQFGDYITDSSVHYTYRFRYHDRTNVNNNIVESKYKDISIGQ